MGFTQRFLLVAAVLTGIAILAFVAANTNFHGLRLIIFGGLLIALMSSMIARKYEPRPKIGSTVPDDATLSEIMKIQDRMEQRIENLETILLSRTHSGVPIEK